MFSYNREKELNHKKAKVDEQKKQENKEMAEKMLERPIAQNEQNYVRAVGALERTGLGSAWRYKNLRFIRNEKRRKRSVIGSIEK